MRALAVGVGGGGIAGTEQVELGFGVVDAVHPGLRAAVAGGVQAGPGVQARVALLHGHGVVLPLQVAGFGIERLQEAGRVDIVAGAHQHMIADHHRGGSREVALRQVGDLLMPALLAGPGVERDQVIVRRFHVEVVVPHAHTAVADVGAPFGLPEIMPELAAVYGIHRPGVVRHGDVQDAVDFQRGGLDGAAAGRDIARTFAAGDDAAAPAAAAEAAASGVAHAGGQAGRPGQGQVLDVGFVDLRQRTEAPAGVIAVVGGPGIAQRLEQNVGSDTGLRQKRRGGQRDEENIFRFHCSPFVVALGYFRVAR